MNLEQLLDKKFSFLRDALVARSCKLAVKSDTDNLPYEGLVIVLGTAGDVKVLTSADDIVTINLEPKEVIPLTVKRVFDTGTTATNIYILR